MPAHHLAAVNAEIVGGLDTGYVESFLGYNARRATLAIGDIFLREMAVYGLRPVDFTLLALIARNPGVTSSQLCNRLDIQSSNLVALIDQLQQRTLIARRPHPRDGRAMGLHLTPVGGKMLRQAEATAAEVEEKAAARLSSAERNTLINLLKKIYA
jgi:DNA-binding MarR family transcriptional regulator